MFALGRLPGWLAHWREMVLDGQRINRPRQVFTEALEEFIVSSTDQLDVIDNGTLKQNRTGVIHYVIWTTI